MNVQSTKRHSIFCGVLLAVVALHVGCGTSRGPVPGARTPQPTASEKTNDGWETADLAAALLDAKPIQDLLERIRNNTYKNIHGVLLVQNGKLVVEEYFPGQQEDGKQQAFTRDTLHEIHSATKSINSILIGIAIDQKLIRSVDEKISTFFPEYGDIFADGKRDAICLKHLLSMTAGLSWDEWTNSYTDVRNDHVAMNRSNDPVRYALERPVVAAPGTKFAYSSGVSIVLGEIIYKVSGLRADKFAERHLFAPLGISEYSWLRYPNGVVQTGGGLSLRPRDMAKIGYLVLQGGRWQEKQIVSERWLEESLKQHAPDAAYGYQWWLGQLQAGDRKVAVGGAQGRGGQFILVMPSVQMAAVFTGWNDGNGLGEQPFDMLRRFILPALKPPSR
jgi:CubicO group peptidase (beta-lactamase class C family)